VFTIANVVSTTSFNLALHWQAPQIGEPYVLPDDNIARVIAKFKNYGQGGDTRKCRVAVEIQPMKI
jgi:hypothetical protein